MAKLRRVSDKELYWREVLNRQVASRSLGESSFYGWRRTFPGRDGKRAPSFVPVVVSDQPTMGTSSAIKLVGGHLLKLPASIPAA